jgi:peptide/nickel transport system permease protein
MTALVAVAFVLFCSYAGGPIVSAVVGHDGAEPFPYATSADLKPVGPWAHVWNVAQPTYAPDNSLAAPPKGTKKTLFVLGADGQLGRDELIRLLDGGRTSLEIGFGGVIVALLIAIPFGSVAGYFGGWPDAVVSRVTETVMAFPLLLFLVFASVRLGSVLRGMGWGGIVPAGVVGDALLIGVFTSFYPTRLIRAQLITLRRAEFVEAEHMIGASDFRILRRHLLPHLLPTLLVWGAIAVATNILLEVGLSFIGVGVQPSTPTWGSMLSTTWGTIYTPLTYGHGSTPWQTIFPTGAILVTVLALNQLSEGVRRAIEPWAGR